METADQILKAIRPLLLEAKADARRVTIHSELLESAKEDPPPPFCGVQPLNELQIELRKRVVSRLIQIVQSQNDPQ
jgi:hypothetical protein